MLRIDPSRFSQWLLASTVILIAGTTSAGPIATAQTLGFRDLSYANSDNLRAPTGSKPESKAWFNDNTWCAILFNPALHATDIYKLDLTTQTWMDTGTPVDDRPTAKGDALWDQASGKLYIASNLHDNSAGPTNTSSNWGRLYRYSYNFGTKVYSLDSGFPVTVTKGTEESLVVAKDSTGTLWVTFIESSRVMVNHSSGSDYVWGIPFVLPVSTTARTTTSDDIASIIAFGGNKIGIFWSNQNTKNDYFAIHQDAEAATTWLPEEIATGGGINCTGACADDHINIKADSLGKIFVASKTSFTGSAQPLINLLVRATDGAWSRTTYSTYAYVNTRGIILLDEPDDRLYFFVTSSEAGGKIDYKITSMSSPSFVDGDGDFFIKIPSDAHINNPTSTKQNITGNTGLLVMGSDDTSRFYVHNFITPSANNAPTILSFTPSSGSEGTSVVITGAGLGGATAVKFNGMNANGFAVESSTQIAATAPESVTGGPITVITSGGTANSATNFTVTDSTRIKDITFEKGSIVDLAAGFDTTSGTPKLETASPIKGADSMTITAGSSYGQQNYVSTDEIFISLYLRIAAVPAGQVRLVRISDHGISVGALTLEATGKLTLRNSSTNLGATTVSLKPGTTYRMAIHQKKGIGSDAILEGFLATGDANFTLPFARNTTQTFVTQADSVQIGATTSMGGAITFDDIRLDAEAMPGPSLP